MSFKCFSAGKVMNLMKRISVIVLNKYVRIRLNLHEKLLTTQGDSFLEEAAFRVIAVMCWRRTSVWLESCCTHLWGNQSAGNMASGH